MRYTVYKTTNTINGKFYVGAHRTTDPDDDYIGSGVLLQRAVKKYGRQAFIKEVLYDFDSEQEMLDKEVEVVNPEFCERDDTYNIAPGGQGGPGVGRIGARKMWEVTRADPEALRQHQERSSRRLKKTHREGKIRYDTFTGRKHTEEAKAKMREAHRKSGHGKGKRNSQYGTCWVCREGEAPRKIPKADLPRFIEAGWQRGRKVRP